VSAQPAQLVFSPRERAPAVVPVARQLARALQEAGRDADAGWLLLSLVAPELIRTEPLAAPSRTLARDAAELLASGGELLAAVEVRLALGEVPFALSLLQARGHEELVAKVKAHEDPPQLLVQAGLDGSLRVASVWVVRAHAARGLEGTVTVSNAEKVLPLAQLLGLHGHVARMAAAVGQHERAAQAWLDAGDRIAAARVFHQLGDPSRALDALVLVEAQHPDYRKACVFAVRLAWKLERLDFDLYHLLGELFARHGQAGPGEELRALSQGKTDGPRVEALPEPDMELPPLPPEPAVLPPSTGPDATLERRQHPAPATARAARGRPDPDLTEEGPERSDADMIGMVIGGRYCIDSLLGRGGHGVVYKATDLALNEQVALKFLKVLGHDREAVKRFRRELKLARRLSHPNIVRVHDLGEDRGAVFLSMELLHGLVLRRLPRSALPLHRAIDVICQSADGLTAARGRRGPPGRQARQPLRDPGRHHQGDGLRPGAGRRGPFGHADGHHRGHPHLHVARAGRELLLGDRGLRPVLAGRGGLHPAGGSAALRPPRDHPPAAHARRGAAAPRLLLRALAAPGGGSSPPAGAVQEARRALPLLPGLRDGAGRGRWRSPPATAGSGQRGLRRDLWPQGPGPPAR
jgi:hypothetical protein